MEAIADKVTPQRTCDKICRDGLVCGRACGPSGRCEEHPAISGPPSSRGVKPTPKDAKNKTARRYHGLLPTHLKESYRKIAASRDLMSLAADIALVEMRKDQMVGRLKTNESADKWTDLTLAFHNFREANRNKDADAMRLWLNECERLIKAGDTEERTWTEILKLQQKKAELVGQESRRHYLMGSTATGEQVRFLAETIIKVVVTHVKDPATLEKISADLEGLNVFDFEVAPPAPPPPAA